MTKTNAGGVGRRMREPKTNNPAVGLSISPPALTEAAESLTFPKPVLSTRDLAGILSISVGTLRNIRSQRPDVLPPPLSLPGRQRLYLWADVRAWLLTHRNLQPTTAPEKPRRRGAPTKTARVLRREGGAT